MTPPSGDWRLSRRRDGVHNCNAATDAEYDLTDDVLCEYSTKRNRET